MDASLLAEVRAEERNTVSLHNEELGFREG